MKEWPWKDREKKRKKNVQKKIDGENIKGGKVAEQTKRKTEKNAEGKTNRSKYKRRRQDS